MFFFYFNLIKFVYTGGAFKTMPQSPKTCGYVQTTPTIKAEMEAKCISANSTNSSTNNNNTIFNFPSVKLAKTLTKDDNAIGRNASDQSSVANGSNFNVSTLKHHEGKNMDVTDLNVNVNVVASSNHVSTSCCPSISSSDSSTNNSSTNIQSSSNKINNNINVIGVCDNSGNVQSGGNGIIITETHHDGASYYDAIKLEENGTTAIIYETIVIENPATHQNQEIIGFISSNNNNNINSYINHNNNINKYVTNNNHITLEATSANNNGGGIIVLTGSLNELLLNQNGHVVTSTQQLCQPHSSGTGSNIKCLSDVKNPIQSIVLNLNSQSSASTTASSGKMGNQQSIMLSINPNQQVNHTFQRICGYCLYSLMYILLIF